MKDKVKLFFSKVFTFLYTHRLLFFTFIFFSLLVWGIVWLFSNFDGDTINVYEQRVYKVAELLLLLFIALTLVLLRNAVMANTGILYKLHNEIKKLVAELQSNTRELASDARDRGTDTNVLKAVMNNLSVSVDALRTSFIESIKKMLSSGSKNAKP